MKVVLTRDVKGVGRQHEAVEAKDGYALNYLIPKKLAVPATPAATKEAELRLKAVKERRELDTKLFAENLAKVSEGHIQIAMKANEQGHLYEAVDAGVISKALAAQHIEMPEEAIQLEKPIKELGTHRVPVALGEAFGEFNIEIIAE
jgi:large subunit ribosomal protein L9